MAITLGLVEAIDSNGVYVSMPGSRGVLRGPYETLQNVVAGDKVLVVTTDDGDCVVVGLAAAAVAGVSIPDGSITSAKIANGTIVDEDISASAAIAKTKISGTAITAADTGTVTSTMIADGTIVNADISGSAAIDKTKVSGTAITAADTGTVTNAMLAGSIAASKITGTAITAADSGTVTSTMIANSTIVNADISGSAAIDRSKISGLPTSSTDNTLPKFDSTGGALQTSGIVVDDNNRLRVASGSTGGLEIGSSGVLNMSGTGGPSGISAPVGSTWRQTDANATHGSLTGLLWNKVGTGTTEGTDWLVDYEGRWVAYTPTWTNVTMSSTTARYTRRGKVATFDLLGTVSSGPSGAVTVTMPVSMAASSAHGPVRISQSGSYQGIWFYASSDAALVRWLYVTGGALIYANLSSTEPTSWSAGHAIYMNGTYEIA